MENTAMTTIEKLEIQKKTITTGIYVADSKAILLIASLSWVCRTAGFHAA
jgi:hypothetical protein